jgi:hypothetical protein
MDLIGPIIGGIGSLIGGNKQADADKQAAQQALTGYNYLTTGPGSTAASSYTNNGTAANNAEAQLLGTQPITDQTSNGFTNYLNSTGYKFQLGQGTQAIAGSAAAKGILNSGATAKALQTYGQGLAAGTFNNYLTQLNGQSAQGQTQLGQIAAAGTAGGGNAAGATQAAGAAQAQGLNGALGAATNALGSKNITNWFGSL